MHPFFSLIPSEDSAAQTLVTVYPLDSLAVFEAKGQDALTFLQGQLTNDIVSPGVGQSRLAGYCTAQGRLLATMVLGQMPDIDHVPTVRGMMRADILAPVLKRLSMFILRSKLTLQAAQAYVAGVTAPSSDRSALVSQLGHPLPESAWETLHGPTGIWIAAPSSAGNAQHNTTVNRWWWIADQDHVDHLKQLKLEMAIGSPESWACQDIQLGLPWIESRTQDLFIPQTLNLELIGGVSFTKGCYPGQEIVARSHYRGTVKKRMALGCVTKNDALELFPGMDIFDAAQDDQPCGRLINVANLSSTDGPTQWLLFETTFDAFDRQQLRVASANGPAIEIASLPYATR